VIKENSRWIVGDGAEINFWLDAWCGDPLIQTLNLKSSQISSFPLKLCNYIHDFHWHLPEEVTHLIPNLDLLVAQVTIPNQS